jgi:uncharacterized protein
MSQTDSPVISETDIEQYLRQHPEFFQKHLDLLEIMQIPHPSGTAISLISKQLELFRTKHHELENQLVALIDIARENDTSFNRLHQLTLALLEADNLEQVVANLEFALAECFGTDFIAVRIIQEAPDDAALSNLFVAPNDIGLQHFENILSSSQPKCGRPTSQQARFLFGEQALEVKSCAIIPLAYTHIQAILAIGSREEMRFHYSMGSLFLTQISEIVATRLVSLL